jgi:hypothetical protein
VLEREDQIHDEAHEPGRQGHGTDMSKEIPGAEQEGERHHDGAAADEQHPELTGIADSLVETRNFRLALRRSAAA